MNVIKVIKVKCDKCVAGEEPAEGEVERVANTGGVAEEGG